MKGRVEHSNIFAKLLLLLGFSLVCTVLLVAVARLIVGTDESDINVQRPLQAVQTVGLFMLPPFLLAYVCSTDTLRFLYLKKTTKTTNYLYVILFMLVAIPFVNFLSDINHRLVLPEWLSGLETWMKTSEQQAEDLTMRMSNTGTINGLLLNILVMALLPALGEELMFRGALLRIFQQWKNKHLAIWVAAAIFSAVHLQFYGFLPRMMLGACFGYMLLWTGSLWLPIVAHFVNNAFIVVVYFLNYRGFIDIDVEFGAGNTWWVGVISGIVAGGLFWLMRRKKF